MCKDCIVSFGSWEDMLEHLPEKHRPEGWDKILGLLFVAKPPQPTVYYWHRERNIFAESVSYYRQDFQTSDNICFPTIVSTQYWHVYWHLCCTILWLQQTVWSSCWGSMFNGTWPVPNNKRFNSAYLKNYFLFLEKIHSNTFLQDETFSCRSQVTMIFWK